MPEKPADLSLLFILVGIAVTAPVAFGIGLTHISATLPAAGWATLYAFATVGRAISNNDTDHGRALGTVAKVITVIVALGAFGYALGKAAAHLNSTAPVITASVLWLALMLLVYGVMALNRRHPK